MNTSFLKKMKIAGTVAVIAAVVFIGIQHSPVTFASPSDNVHGFAWSDAPDGSDRIEIPGNLYGGRGFGWISLNSADHDPYPLGSALVNAPYNVPYGVLLNPITGQISGYGWSEMGGWIQFDPAGAYPVGPGTVAGGAHVDPTCLQQGSFICPILGWARFVSGSTPESGGWDGWVSLNGKGYGWKITGNQGTPTATVTGDAWGDWVAGWIRAVSVTVDMVMPPKTLTCSAPGNLATVQVFYTYLDGDPIPPECTILYCPGVGPMAGRTFEYAVGAPVPSECVDGTSSTPTTRVCTKLGAVNYTPPPLGPNMVSDNTICNFDHCRDDRNYPATLGIQTRTPFTVDGVIYDVVNDGVCIPDQCPDNASLGSDPAVNLTLGFQATPSFTGSDGKFYSTIAGVCKPGTPPKTCDPAVETCPAIIPIYKEN